MNSKTHPLLQHILSVTSLYMVYGILISLCTAIALALLPQTSALEFLKSNYALAVIGYISLSVPVNGRPYFLECFSGSAFKMPRPAALTSLLHLVFSVTGLLLITLAYQLLNHPLNNDIETSASHTIVGAISVFTCCMISRLVSAKISDTRYT